jgi:hypothetical protein
MLLFLSSGCHFPYWTALEVDMKKLLILPLLVLLTGCVTYYYPETALEDGVYYAEDDPSYVVYSDPYASFAYYPWSSLDYFYLGYNPYPSWGFGYSYYNGVSFGISYRYSPWYYPYNYYGYYSPWYASHYHYYPGWHRYRGYCSGHKGCGHHNKKKHRGDRHDRYAGNRNDDRYDRSDEDLAENRHDSKRRDRAVSDGNSASVRRYVSTAPAGYSSDRGMVVRSKESKKIGKSYPGKSNRAQSVKVTSSGSSAATPNYSAKRTTSGVRYRSDTKQNRSRTGPVSQGSSAKGLKIAAAPPVNARATASAGKSGQSVRPPSNSRPSAQTRPKTSSGKSKRSHSSAYSGSRSSKNSRSSRRKDRN